jgi:hypothetical protein
VQPDAAAHFCEIQMTLAENLPAIQGNPNQIQQVLINLVSNAFEAMSQTPPTRRKVKIDTEYHDDEKVRVSVRDYGCGIPNEARARIFEHFLPPRNKDLEWVWRSCVPSSKHMEARSRRKTPRAEASDFISICRQAQMALCNCENHGHR